MRDPMYAWRDTARPTKAPTATPIPSISAQRCLLQSDGGKSVPRPPGTGLDDDSRWGQNRDGRNRNECPCVTRCMLGVTLPGLQRHQQQRLYQASLHKDVCYRATASVPRAPGTGLDDDSRWGQNTDGRSRNECPCVTRCMLGVTLPGLQRHQQQRLYQASPCNHFNPLPSDSRKTVAPAHAPGTGLDDDSRWGQNTRGRSRNEMSMRYPMYAWRDTARPTKAPTATPIPSISAQYPAYASGIGLDAGANTKTAETGTKCLTV